MLPALLGYLYGDAFGIMAIILGNGLGRLSSNPVCVSCCINVFGERHESIFSSHQLWVNSKIEWTL